jgi:hypothetical protein
MVCRRQWQFKAKPREERGREAARLELPSAPAEGH